VTAWQEVKSHQNKRVMERGRERDKERRQREFGAREERDNRIVVTTYDAITLK
jgi:hypothetical protein